MSSNEVTFLVFHLLHDRDLSHFYLLNCCQTTWGSPFALSILERRAVCFKCIKYTSVDDISLTIIKQERNPKYINKSQFCMIFKCDSKVNFHGDSLLWFFCLERNIYVGNNKDGRIFLRCNLREKMPAIFLTLRFQAYATPPLPQILLSNILLTKTKECLSEHGLDQVKCSDLEDYFRHLSN